MQQVVAFAGPLAHAREHGVTAVLLGHITDELLDDDRLAHARATEDADLAPLGEGRDEVDDLDAGLEQFDGRGLVLERGRLAMDGVASLGLHGALAIDGLAQHIEYAAEGRGADRYGDGPARVGRLDTPCQSVRGSHGHGTYPVVAQVLLDLARDRDVTLVQHHRVVDGRQLAGWELDIHDWAGDGDHPADGVARARMWDLWRLPCG